MGGVWELDMSSLMHLGQFEQREWLEHGHLGGRGSWYSQSTCRFSFSAVFGSAPQKRWGQVPDFVMPSQCCPSVMQDAACVMLRRVAIRWRLGTLRSKQLWVPVGPIHRR